MTGMAPDEILRRIAAAANRPRGSGIRRVRLPVSSAAMSNLIEAVRNVVGPLGYAVIEPRRSCESPADRVLAHRHLVLLCLEPGHRSETAEWVRLLWTTSPRAHVVADCVPCDVGTSTGPVSEPGEDGGGRGHDEHDSGANGCGPASRRLHRACRLAARGRHAAAERWLRAELASAGRRRDSPAETAAALGLVELLAFRGRLTAAAETGLRLLGRSAAAPSDALVRLVSRVLLEAADLGLAEAVVSGFEVECELRGSPVPGWIRWRRAEALWWQGRLEEAWSAVGQAAPTCAGDGIVLALLAWSTADRARLEEAASCLEGEPARRSAGELWAGLLRCLAWRERPVVIQGRDWRDDLDRLTALSRQAGPTRPVLARALLADLLASAGRGEAARAVVASLRASGCRAPLDELLVSWLEARGRPEQERVGAAVRRHRALGILKYGNGRKGMHLVQSLPTVLEALAAAEDEATALASCCRWARGQPTVEAAGVTATGGGLIAADGLSEHDLCATEVAGALSDGAARTVEWSGRAVAVAPIRYVSRTVGLAVVCADVEAAATAEQVAAALAAVAAPALSARLEQMAFDQAASSCTPELVGRNAALDEVRHVVLRAAATTFPVLVEGESGTGKELVARALHRLSPRRGRRFCAVNCAALTDELIEAELFGHARGAFTGAVGVRPGLFEEAHGGTLFLDEVSELSPRAQAKLLRALQEREVRRLGENAPRAVDVRVISATNRPLADAVASGAFREDLLFRLAVVRVRLPPLRERLDDLALLAQACWRQASAETGTRAALDASALAALARHRWPGNVRELQNVIAALALLAPRRGRVGAREVAAVLSSVAQDASRESLERARMRCDRRTIAGALARYGGQRAPAARDLGLTRQGLTKAMRRVGLNVPRRRPGVA